MPRVEPSPPGQAGFLIEASGDGSSVYRMKSMPKFGYNACRRRPTSSMMLVSRCRRGLRPTIRPPELPCLNEIDHLEPEETVAVVEVSNGRWELSGLRACLCKLAYNSPPTRGEQSHSSVRSLGLTGALSVRQGQVEGQRGPSFLGRPFDV